MNIHEYQAKEILKNFGLPVLQGKSYSKNLDTLYADIEDLNGPPWVVKSQIHALERSIKQNVHEEIQEVSETVYKIESDVRTLNAKNDVGENEVLSVE